MGSSASGVGSANEMILQREGDLNDDLWGRRRGLGLK